VINQMGMLGLMVLLDPAEPGTGQAD
jgi:hypothetical protein